MRLLGTAPPLLALLALLECASTPCGGHRLSRRARALVTRPPPLPARPAHVARHLAAAAVPSRGGIDILTLVSASRAAARDVSVLIDAVAAQQGATR
jgi:hypothetical protein